MTTKKWLPMPPAGPLRGYRHEARTRHIADRAGGDGVFPDVRLCQSRRTDTRRRGGVLPLCLCAADYPDLAGDARRSETRAAHRKLSRPYLPQRGGDACDGAGLCRSEIPAPARGHGPALCHPDYDRDLCGHPAGRTHPHGASGGGSDGVGRGVDHPVAAL